MSSSSSIGILNGAAFCQSISATGPRVGAARGAGGISAGDPPVDAANDAPAIPSTDTALFGRFPFEARFACAIAESSPTSRDQICNERIALISTFL
jgi:hypothetical protein